MNPLDHARTFLGTKEVPGPGSNPTVLDMLQLDGNKWVTGDETPWCSAFVNWVAKECGLERSRNLAARSWLKVGEPITRAQAQPGDVVILKRGIEPQPGPEVINASGHVGFLDGFESAGKIRILGGNQGDQVSVASFLESRVLGYRRLRPVGVKTT